MIVRCMCRSATPRQRLRGTSAVAAGDGGDVVVNGINGSANWIGIDPAAFPCVDVPVRRLVVARFPMPSICGQWMLRSSCLLFMAARIAGAGRVAANQLQRIGTGA
jgi:hypothetical protein